MQPIFINDYAGSYIEAPRANIIIGNSDLNYISFVITFDNKVYTAIAKIFAETSLHGIRNGRISKLTLKDSNHHLIFDYDRGWNIRTKGNEKLLNQLLKIFS